jgi:hypothetical protein
MLKKVGERNSIAVIALLAVLLVGGCKKKKQQAQIAQPPTITAPQTAPPVQTPPTANNGSATNPNQSTTNQQPSQPSKPQAAQTQTKPKPKSRAGNGKPSAAHKAPPSTETPAADKNSGNGNTQVAQSVPPKITIEADSPDVGGAISATGPHSDDVHDKLNTEQLLQTTDDNLKSIKRQLTVEEQAQVVQIRNFMAQSRAASTDSDLVRARNLALKAHLLSDELVRHR